MKNALQLLLLLVIAILANSVSLTCDGAKEWPSGIAPMPDHEPFSTARVSKTQLVRVRPLLQTRGEKSDRAPALGESSLPWILELVLDAGGVPFRGDVTVELDSLVVGESPMELILPDCHDHIVDITKERPSWCGANSKELRVVIRSSDGQLWRGTCKGETGADHVRFRANADLEYAPTCVIGTASVPAKCEGEIAFYVFDADEEDRLSKPGPLAKGYCDSDGSFSASLVAQGALIVATYSPGLDPAVSRLVAVPGESVNAGVLPLVERVTLAGVLTLDGSYALAGSIVSAETATEFEETWELEGEYFGFQAEPLRLVSLDGETRMQLNGFFELHGLSACGYEIELLDDAEDDSESVYVGVMQAPSKRRLVELRSVYAKIHLWSADGERLRHDDCDVHDGTGPNARLIRPDSSGFYSLLGGRGSRIRIPMKDETMEDLIFDAEVGLSGRGVVNLTAPAGAESD